MVKPYRASLLHLLGAFTLLGEVDGSIFSLIDYTLCLPLVENAGCPVVVYEFGLNSCEPGLELNDLLVMPLALLFLHPVLVLDLTHLILSAPALRSRLQKVCSRAS